jgi:hypothetical protein
MNPNKQSMTHTMKGYILFIFLIFSLLNTAAQSSAVYHLELQCTPENSGWMYGAGDYAAGDWMGIGVDSNYDFRFVGWKENGVIISTDAWFSYQMPDHDVVLIAVFEYDPGNPDEPYTNGQNWALIALPQKGATGQTIDFPVYLLNANIDVYALRFNIEFPQGAVVNPDGVTLSNRKNGHLLTVTSLGNNKFSVSITNSQGNYFHDSNGVLIRIPVTLPFWNLDDSYPVVLSSAFINSPGGEYESRVKNGSIGINQVIEGEFDPVSDLTGSVSGGSVTLQWIAPNNETLTGYTIYRNNRLIHTLSNPATTIFIQENVYNGNYTYCVKAQYYNVVESESVCIPVAVTEGNDAVCAPVRNLQANVIQGTTVDLNWSPPITEGWIGYSGDIYSRWGWGDNQTIDHSMAVYWSPEDLAGLSNGEYLLKKIKFIPTEANCTYSVRVWTQTNGGEPVMIADQPVTQSLHLFEWTEVTLENPLNIDLSQGLLIGLRVSTTGGYPMACDAGPAIYGKSNLLFYGNSSWMIHEGSGNWCLAGYIESADGASPVILQPSQSKPEMPSFVRNLSLNKQREPRKTKQGELIDAKALEQLSQIQTPTLIDQAKSFPAQFKTVQKTLKSPEAGVMMYQIYRNGILIGTSASTHYTDLPPESNITYTYCISALYNDGCESAQICTEATTSDCTVSSFPWEEGFEGDTYCWSPYDMDGTGTYWHNDNSGYIYNGTHSFRHTYSGSNTEDGWLVSPKIVIPDNSSSALSFWSFNLHSSDYVKNSVLISTGDSDPNGNDFIEIWSPNEVSASWLETTIDLSAYTGQEIYIAFRYYGYNAHNWYLDDIKIETIPLVPDLAITKASTNYSQVPLKQTEAVSFHASVRNEGQRLTTPATLKVTVNNPENYMGNTTFLDLNTFEKEVFSISQPSFTTATTGNYTASFEVAWEDDENLSNNFAATTFAVSQNTFAKDRENFFSSLGIDGERELGNLYELRENDIIGSFSIAFGNNSDAMFSLRIYQVNEAQTSASLLYESEIFNRSAATIPYAFHEFAIDPQLLQAGKYLFAIHSYVHIGVAYETPDAASDFYLVQPDGTLEAYINHLTFGNIAIRINTIELSSTDATLIRFIDLPEVNYEPGEKTIQVELVNRGLSPLTNASISWTLDETSQTEFKWTGSLALSEKANVTLGTADLSVGHHTLSASVNVADDTDETNNTIEISIEVKNPEILPYATEFDGSLDGWESVSIAGYKNWIWSNNDASSIFNFSSASAANGYAAFYAFNLPDYIGPDASSAALVSPPFDFSGIEDDIILSFRHIAQGYTGVTTEIKIQASADNFAGDVRDIWSSKSIDSQEIFAAGAQKINISPLAGLSNVRLRFLYSGGYAYGWLVDDITIIEDKFASILLSPESMPLTFEQSSDYPWLPEVEAGYVKSGNPGIDSSNSFFTTTIENEENREISFEWFASSESRYDFFRFWVDDRQLISHSGEYSSEFEPFIFQLPVGSHTLKWEYSKDGSVSNREDIAKIRRLKVIQKKYDPWLDFIIDENNVLIAYRGWGGDIVIPEGVLAIQNEVFRDNQTITSVVIPSSVIRIGSYAFYNCNSLVWVDLPASVTSIENYAFAYCSNLHDITVHWETPLAINTSVFNGTPLSNITLSVPKNKTADYKTSNIWRDFRYVLSLEEEQQELLFDQLDPMWGSWFDGQTIHFNYDGWGGAGWWFNPPKNASDYAYIVAEYEPNKEYTFVFINEYEGYDPDNPATVEFRTTLEEPRASIKSIIKLKEENKEGLISVHFYNPRQEATELTLKRVYLLKEEQYPDIEKNITVHVETPGTLGELLTPVQKLLVTDITVTGTIDIRDCIVMRDNMPSLENIDLSGVSVAAYTSSVDPKYYNYYYNQDVFPVGAFYQCEHLKTIQLPHTVTSIGQASFVGCKNLTNVIIPNMVIDISYEAFYGCESLTEIQLPESVHSIGEGVFYGCSNLYSVTLPQNITVLNSNLFNNCTKLSEINLSDLSNLTTISDRVFYNCNSLLSVELPASLTSIGYYVFYYCYNLNSIQYFTYSPVALNHDPFYGVNKMTCELIVPAPALEIFQAANVWKDFLLTGQEKEIKDIYIHIPVTFTGNIRPAGKPNITITPSGFLRLQGDSPFETDHFRMCYRGKSQWYWGYDEGGNYYEYYQNQQTAGFINETENISAEMVSIQIEADANRWYYWSFPFDVKIADIQIDPDVQFVFRKYDGEMRAAIGTGNSWQNVTDTLYAGQGYIFQCNENVYNLIVKPTSETRQTIFASGTQFIPLSEYYSANVSNRSWNLVGNPFPSYFDLRGIEFIAPLTVWNGSGYVAISPLDDDYIFSPFQAFFVQKPSELNKITFVPEGRQANFQSRMDVPVSLQAAAININRRIINLYLSNEKQEDKSRVVINPAADLAYELQYDAAKFMSPDNRMPQIYSVDASLTSLAINERPLEDGIVRLGYYAGETGKYTLYGNSAADDLNVLLIDKSLNLSIDMNQEDYTFDSEAGTFNDRFELRISENGTGLKENIRTASIVNVSERNIIIQTKAGNLISVYAMDGRKIKELLATSDITRVPLVNGVYIVKINNEIFKIIVY